MKSVLQSPQGSAASISLVTVSFNAGATLPATLASVAAQVHPVEHIVVDGGSSDSTVDLLRASQAQLASWVSERDEGLYDAMNKGVRMATGDYVGFLNSDDVFATPGATARVAEAIARTGADVICGDIAMVHERTPGKVHRHYRAHNFRTWQLRFGHMPPHPGCYVRRELLLANPFRTDLRVTADYDLLVRLAGMASVSWHMIDQTLVAMRLGGISTGGFASTREINREMARVLRDHGVRSHPLLLWSRYLAKIGQYAGRPRDLPPGWCADFAADPRRA